MLFAVFLFCNFAILKVSSNRVVAFLVILPFVLVYTVFVVWAERKVAGFIQDRLGPMEVGYKGLLQTIADLLKLIQKEDIVPGKAMKWIFLVAPVVIIVSILAGFATLPLAPGLIGSATKVGAFWMISIVAIDVLGYVMAGWGSNNKYAVLGAMRAVAQIISYEVPLTLIVLSMLMIAQTLDLQEVSMQQSYLQEGNYLFGIQGWVPLYERGGFLSWNIIRFPLSFIGFVVYFIASLAEANRGPFDIAEAESEIIAGFHTEYSGFRWSMIMLGEYAMLLLVGLLGSVLFFGGWNTFLPNIGNLRLAEWTTGTIGEFSGYIWGAFWLFSKGLIWVLVSLWVRWTYPRLRVDQLMYLCWKVLTPLSMIMVLLAGLWRMLMI